MSKMKPAHSPVILAPPEWSPANACKRSSCSNCNILQNLLEGAMAKIERLENKQAKRAESIKVRSNPTINAAALWAEQNEEIAIAAEIAAAARTPERLN